MSEMDNKDQTFLEFQAYWRLAEEMIARASKEELAETARILALQAAHYARKYGQLDLPDLQHLLTTLTVDEESVGLMRDGSEALVGVLGIVTTDELADTDSSLQ